MKLFVMNSELYNPKYTSKSFTLNYFGFEEAQWEELKLHTPLHTLLSQVSSTFLLLVTVCNKHGTVWNSFTLANDRDK